MVAELQLLGAVRREDRGVVLVLPTAGLFKGDKAELSPAGMAELGQLAETLGRGARGASVAIEGHTERRATEALGDDLSRRRAEAVAEYLAARGLGKDRLTAKGLGSAHPITQETSKEGRARNNRVEIVVAVTSDPAQTGIPLDDKPTDSANPRDTAKQQHAPQ